MRQTNVRGNLSLRGFRKLRTGAIVATGVILLGLGFLAPTVSANEQDGVWVARTVAEVKADIQHIDNLSHYTIKWGDTLSAISGATGLSVDSLVEINRIANRDLIFANNKLYFSEEAFLKDGNTEVKRQRVSIDNSGSCQSYEVETKTDTVTGEQTTTVKQTTPVVVETPAATEPKADEPVVTTPKADEPVVTTPKADEPVATTPKADEPATPAPKVEEPATPAPKAEEPATPAPKADEPTAGTTPKADEPAAGTTPKADEPVVTTPKADEPATPAPKVEEPVTPAPKADEPVSPAPKVEEPVTPAPKAEEPVTPAPKAEEPATPAPKVEEPATEPKAEEPATPAPKADEPTAGTTPKADEPAAGTTPKADEPSATTPKAEAPAATDPKSDEPTTPAPKVEAPAATDPKSDEPVATDPKAEEPATPAPKAEEPATPAPKAEEPATPAPKEEKPATPAPKAEEPVSSAPKVEEPATPAPKAEEPAAGTTPKAEEPSAGTTPKSEESTAPAPKSDEPAASEPKVEEPATPAPKSDEPAASEPKVEEPATPAPKSDEPAVPAPKVEEPAAGTTPKDDESASSVESPSTGNHSEESGAPSTTPTGDSTATQPSDSTSTPVTPSEEAPVTSGDTNSTTQPAGETGHSETTAEPSNTPSAEATNDSGSAATSGSVTDNTSSNTGTADQPVASNPSSEEPSAGTTPKAEEPSAGTKEDAPSEEVAPKDEKLEEAKKDGKDAIEKIAASKLSEIEKVKDEVEKAKLEAKLKELKEAGLAAIKNAENHDAAVDATDEYQTKIDEINVPGEELPAPNYNKDNLTNGRNEGTTINDGSTAIGHGSGEAPTQPASEERSTSTASPTQPYSTSERASSFRNAPSVQARARRVVRSTSEPDGTVNISYNFAGMPDIHGFLSDPGENNTVTIPAGTSEAQAKELVKEKIQAKIKDLAARGYHVKNDIIFEQDTTVKNYNYVVTFTKEATGTSGFRMAPAVQPRASRNRRSLEQPAPQKVKVNVFYNFDQMKDIAGFLGDINGTPLEVAEGSTNEQVKAAVKNQVDAKKEELRKRGYTFKEDYVYQANGKDYNYVVTFTKEATGTSGFRMAPAVQPRASRNRRSLEQPAPQKVKVNVFYNFDKMKDIAGFLGDINGTSLEIAEGLSNEQVKAAVKSQVDAKKEELSKRGYTFKEDYVYQSNGKDYNYVVTFSKATK